jgi:SAM-dependent methyltransferase
VSVENRLSTVYHANSREALAQTYNDWAATYDSDMQSIGYVHPAIMTGLVARYIPHLHATILDAGVGTGTLGQMLNILGYENLIGIDMSDGMLERAASRKVYASLRNQILGQTLDFETASIDCIVSTGTFTTGHAPAAAFDELLRITKPGGFLIFTVGTTVWHEAGFDQKIKSLPLNEVETTKIYHPMPHSASESGFTTRAHVYRRSA